MANQLDLYIMESKKHEQSGNVEMELYAELQKISASSNTITTVLGWTKWRTMPTADALTYQPQYRPI